MNNISIFQDLITNIPAQAVNEAGSSNLPGKDSGPYDAYSHILWTAEMTRRYGESVARIVAEKHEIDGYRAGQSIQSENMDRYNNETGYKIGKEAKSWADVVKNARDAISESAKNTGVTNPSSDGGGVPEVGSPATWQSPKDWQRSEFEPNPAPTDKNGYPLPRDQWNWPESGSDNPINWPNDPYPQPKKIPKPPDGNYSDGTNWGDIFDKTANRIGDAIHDFFERAKNWVLPRDPLILDLDGNGIQTRAIDPAAPILFDHNADGIKTGTGWVGAGEGMVVLDLDGNGSIDSGRELFGDNTVITSGARAGQLAANGFEAIAQYDADADGAINSSDAIYSQLRIWQDGNADGISQSAELKTLAELGIASIGVAGQTDGSSLGGGNTQAQKGSFTRTDGSTGNSASVQLAANNFYRKFTDDPALVQAAALQKARFVAGKTHFIAAIF